ncbi:hypothetical protein A2154_01280 [Candidatus Gottesmanbacteria bacterium RBG_16_43_7]|uniref:Uncharacterized protein n=1 Tax=Candidatus Gottesmanbacteria bacterium RBG_16_43_7 TaxID=1798373 RepID=A0A1F5Z990_9BACT|nr:MAG: hypothetical protein A2154_01280 [Candidatus Gottesmanbacteria bacterium RBG_16_43_7]
MALNPEQNRPSANTHEQAALVRKKLLEAARHHRQLRLRLSGSVFREVTSVSKVLNDQLREYGASIGLKPDKNTNWIILFDPRETSILDDVSHNLAATLRDIYVDFYRAFQVRDTKQAVNMATSSWDLLSDLLRLDPQALEIVPGVIDFGFNKAHPIHQHVKIMQDRISDLWLISGSPQDKSDTADIILNPNDGALHELMSETWFMMQWVAPGIRKDLESNGMTPEIARSLMVGSSRYSD